jgi:hypothetical protein
MKVERFAKATHPGRRVYLPRDSNTYTRIGSPFSLLAAGWWAKRAPCSPVTEIRRDDAESVRASEVGSEQSSKLGLRRELESTDDNGDDLDIHPSNRVAELNITAVKSEDVPFKDFADVGEMHLQTVFIFVLLDSKLGEFACCLQLSDG